MDSKDFSQNFCAKKEIDELDNYKERIRSRMCPYCKSSIKHYIFSSINVPTEHMAQTYAEYREESQSRYLFYTWGNNFIHMFSRILLTSTCECGNVSFWECDLNDIKALIDKNMNDDGYFIELIYSKNVIQDMYNNAKNEKLKEELRGVLTLFPNDEEC